MGQKLLVSSDLAQPVVRAIEQFQGAVFGKHHPVGACFTCVDGREEAGGYLPLGDSVHVLRFTEFAGIIPTYENAGHALKGKLSFRKLKDIPIIKIIGHSSCGAAQLVIDHPDSFTAPDEDIRNIVLTIEDSGADLPRLRDAFMKVCEGNKSHAADLLSRHLVVVSLANISEYPHINDQIMTQQLDVVPLYHLLKEESGEASHLERFDVAHQRWYRVDESFVPNMCERPDDCGSCGSCYETIDKSLSWAPVEYANDQGQIDSVMVPFHIAGLLKEHRAIYQPQLSDIHQPMAEIVAQPIRFYSQREFI